MQSAWYTKSADQTTKAFHSHASDGLSSKDIARRRKKYGPNALPKKSGERWWLIALRQFASPLVYILFFGAAISFYVEEFVDGGVIIAAVLINSVIGFIQEYRANNALAHIQEHITFHVTVIRDGKEHRLLVKDLVPGDVVRLTSGDRVPADGRLIEHANIATNEAALTGESLPVEKTIDALKVSTGVSDRTNYVFLGTSIVRGTGKMIVTDTGIHTELGKITKLLSQTKDEPTPLQAQLTILSRWLAGIFLTLSAGIVVIGLVQQRSITEILVTAIAVAVAAIPEGARCRLNGHFIYWHAANPRKAGNY